MLSSVGYISAAGICFLGVASALDNFSLRKT